MIATGFAVAGRRGGKEDASNYLSVNTEGTQVYFDNETKDGDKVIATGFAVAGRRGGKEDASNYLSEIGRASCRERVCLYV